MVTKKIQFVKSGTDILYHNTVLKFLNIRILIKRQNS